MKLALRRQDRRDRRQILLLDIGIAQRIFERCKLLAMDADAAGEKDAIGKWKHCSSIHSGTGLKYPSVRLIARQPSAQRQYRAFSKHSLSKRRQPLLSLLLYPTNENWRQFRARRLLRGLRARRGLLAAARTKLSDPARDHIEHRREDQAEQRSRRSCRRKPRCRASAAARRRRRSPRPAADAENEGERRHQDRTQPQPRGLDRRRPAVAALILELARTRRSGSRSWRQGRSAP